MNTGKPVCKWRGMAKFNHCKRFLAVKQCLNNCVLLLEALSITKIQFGDTIKNFGSRLLYESFALVR